MVKLAASCLGAALLLAACATPELSDSEAAAVAVEAFEAAGLQAAEPAGLSRQEVDLAVDEGSDEARSAEVWLMTIEVEGEEWTVGVDPDRGAVVRTFEPAGSELTDAQVQALADYENNPAADRAAKSRQWVILGLFVAILVGGYLALRAFARRDLANPEPEIVEPDD